MITHLIKSINWVDAALAVLFIRMILVGVKNGFLSEFFKLLGIVAAVFVSFHYYSYLASWVTARTHAFWDWDGVIFAGLWLAVTFFFKLLRDGILVLFKAETTHQGFDKYAAGVVAVGRGVLVCSMTLFLVFLVHIGSLSRMALHSFSYKIAGRAALKTYDFLYNNVVDKLFAGEHYNAAAARVLHPEANRE